jgi:hypothetical protein
MNTARTNAPAVAAARPTGTAPRRFLALAAVALATLWCGALWANGGAGRASTAARPEPAPVSDALILAATPETAGLARALGERFCAEHPGVRLRLSVRPAGEAFDALLGRSRALAVLVPRVTTTSEAERFAAAGASLIQFPLRLDPYAGPGQPRPGEPARTVLLYSTDETVRGREVVREFSVYARRYAPSLTRRVSEAP